MDQSKVTQPTYNSDRRHDIESIPDSGQQFQSDCPTLSNPQILQEKEEPLEKRRRADCQDEVNPETAQLDANVCDERKEGQILPDEVNEESDAAAAPVVHAGGEQKEEGKKKEIGRQARPGLIPDEVDPNLDEEQIDETGDEEDLDQVRLDFLKLLGTDGNTPKQVKSKEQIEERRRIAQTFADVPDVMLKVGVRTAAHVKGREAAIFRGAICPRHSGGANAKSYKCNCVRPKPSMFLSKEFLTAKPFVNENHFYDVCLTRILPRLKEVLTESLIAEYGKVAFKSRFPDYNKAEKDFPEPYKTHFMTFRHEVLRYCWETRKTPILFIDFTGKYDVSKIPSGRWSDGVSKSTMVERLNGAKKEMLISCGPDCGCSNGSGEQCECTNEWPLNRRERLFFDKHGTCRASSGATFAGIDNVSTKLTRMEKESTVIISCGPDCECGDTCNQNVMRGCRYVQILNIDPDCGLDVRAEEVIPRGQIASVMSGHWVDRSEEADHDARMFFGFDKNCTLTNDSRKNNFFTYNHSCRPTMVSTMCYVERNPHFPRPILLTRATLQPGTRMTFHYNPDVTTGSPFLFKCGCGSAPDCCSYNPMN